MKLLIDTHFLIWLGQEPELVRDEEQRLLAAAEQRFLSAVSLWEIRISG